MAPLHNLRPKEISNDKNKDVKGKTKTKMAMVGLLLGSLIAGSAGMITTEITEIKTKHDKDCSKITIQNQDHKTQIEIPIIKYEPLVEDIKTSELESFSEPLKVCIQMKEERPFQEKVGEKALELVIEDAYIGKYEYQYNDCYDFVTKVAWAVKHNRDVKKILRYRGHYGSIYSLGWIKKIRFSREHPDIQTGDIIYVKRSPVSRVRPHWGICYRIDDQVYVIHKTGSTPSVDKLDWFIRYCREDEQIEIFRNDEVITETVTLSIPSLTELAQKKINKTKRKT